MIRLSALRNYPVVCDQKQIGLLQDFCLDAAQIKVNALIISCGIQGKRIVQLEDILSLADGFILVRAAYRYRRSLDARCSRMVRDTSGLLTGRVTDYAISKTKWTVAAIEMQIGYGPCDRHRRLWIYDYQCIDERKNELTVPSSLGSELIMAEEENSVCVCQP